MEKYQPTVWVVVGMQPYFSNFQIDWMLQHEDFSITDIPKKICVAQFMVELTIAPGLIEGDIKAQNFEEILDVKRGLEKFFEDSIYGVLCARSRNSIANWIKD